MIVCHEYKFIFLKTRKVGGTSLEIALSKYCGKDDIITPIRREDEATRQALGFRGPQNYRIPIPERTLRDWLGLVTKKKCRKFYNHLPAAEARDALGDETWNNYFKFSVVRNPFDAMISRYFWQHRAQEAPPFDIWLLNNPDALLDNKRIYRDGPVPAVDKLVRYEHLQTDLAEVAEAVGLPENPYEVMRSIRAKSRFRDRQLGSSSFYASSPDCRRLVEILAKDEIEMFGYSPDEETAGGPQQERDSLAALRHSSAAVGRSSEATQ